MDLILCEIMRRNPENHRIPTVCLDNCLSHTQNIHSQLFKLLIIANFLFTPETSITLPEKYVVVFVMFSSKSGILWDVKVMKHVAILVHDRANEGYGSMT